MKNIEIKYRTDELNEIKIFLLKSPDISEVWTKRQIDTYFRIAKGRLKLREENESTSHLIYYQRSNRTHTRESDYEIYYSDNPVELINILKKIFGILVRVDKRRNLLMFRNVRIHLDEVKNLGNFMELESVVDEHTGEARARDNLRKLQTMLANFKLEPVSVSYSDLLIEKEKIIYE